MKVAKYIACTACVCLLTAAVFLWRSWASADNLVHRVIADPGCAMTHADYDTLLHYFAGTYHSRAPWQRISPALERSLIKAGMERISFCDDVFLYSMIVTRWNYCGEFRDLPAMVSEFLNRRDDAASAVLDYSSGLDRKNLLTEFRIKSLLGQPTTEGFQMSLILNSDITVLEKNMLEFESLKDHGRLSDKAWEMLRARIQQWNDRKLPKRREDRVRMQGEGSARVCEVGSPVAPNPGAPGRSNRDARRYDQRDSSPNSCSS